MSRSLALQNLTFLPVLLLAGGCSRVTRTAEGTPHASAAPSPAATPTNGPAPRSALEAGAPRAAPDVAVVSFACRLPDPAQTIEDGQGQGSPDGQSELENTRLVVDDTTDTTVVTWERQSNFKMGDSWHVPMAATRSKGGAFRVAEFPVDAYASATYGYIATNTASEQVVTWGVANTRGFELWSKVPRTTKDSVGRSMLVTRADRTILTKKQELNGFAVSRGVALARTIDGACDTLSLCSDKPARYGLWLFGLDSGNRFATRIASGSDVHASGPLNSPEVPAIAMGAGEVGGAAAYRFEKALWLVWLDAAGKPLGPPERFDAGDVGAPALAIAGTNVVVVWARRETKTDAYQLRLLDVAPRASLGAPLALATPKSAFAPAVIADDASITLAWTEGDDAKSGEVRLARLPRHAPAPTAPTPLPSVVASGAEEPNARDPELSGTPAAPALVWSSFTKQRSGGAVRFARASCEAR